MKYIDRNPTSVGIYAIVNIKNGMAYVGQSSNVYQRYLNHCQLLRKGKSENPKLQNDFDKFGEDSFEFRILESCTCIEELNNAEYYWSTKFPLLYNIRTCGRSNLTKQIHPQKAPRSDSHMQSLRKSSPFRRPVISTDAVTGEQIYYPSMSEASRCLGMSQANISDVISGKQKSAYGKLWRYADDEK